MSSRLRNGAMASFGDATGGTKRLQEVEHGGNMTDIASQADLNHLVVRLVSYPSHNNCHARNIYDRYAVLW